MAYPEKPPIKATATILVEQEGKPTMRIRFDVASFTSSLDRRPVVWPDSPPAEMEECITHPYRQIIDVSGSNPTVDYLP